MATPLTRKDWLIECGKLAKIYEDAMTNPKHTSSDLVAEIRKEAAIQIGFDGPAYQTLTRWADRIEALEGEVERLRGAFAKGVGPDDPAGCPGDNGDSCCGYHEMCRAALAKGE